MCGNETGYAMLGGFGEISCPTVKNFARAISLTNRLTPQYCIPDVELNPCGIASVGHYSKINI
jgi:hypothetical protein